MRINIGTNPLNIPKNTLDLNGTPYISKFNPAYKNSNLENIVTPLPKAETNVNIDTSYFEMTRQKFVLKDGSMQLEETVNNQINHDFCTNDLDCDYVDNFLFNDINGLENKTFSDDEFHTMINDLLSNDKPVQDMLVEGGYNTVNSMGFQEKVESVIDWFIAVKEHGFFVATYDKTFLQLFCDFFVDLFNVFVKFFIGNSDIFFLLPLMLVLTTTFFFGKNKYSKLAIPFAFAYFVAKISFIIFYR